MSEEERIRAYVRSRADVSVPTDLRWPTAASESRRRWAIASAGTWVRLAVAGLVVAVVAVGIFLNAPTPTGTGQPSTPPASGSTQPISRPPDAKFPAEVAGLPVISVANADALLQAGKLDGQAVAVAGYFDAFSPSCPYSGRYIGPLEGWCEFVAFTDTSASARMCQPEGTNGISCSEPSGTNLAPFSMSETSGDARSWLTGGGSGEPAALVLIGHAGDARQWQCTASTRAQCASAFVVDRIAWAEGHDVPPTAPQTGDQSSGRTITPRMTLAQAAAALGLGDDPLTGAPFRAGDIATVDPRWNFAGDNVVWLVRSLGQAVASDARETRPEMVWLLDDATGTIIDSHRLQLDADYQPARLWPMATVHGLECCLGETFAFYRVEPADGAAVYEGLVSGGSSGAQDVTTFGGGYGSGPLVLPAGDYSITVWLASYNGGSAGPPRDECSTRVTLGPLGDVRFNADFVPNQACTFQPAPSPSPGS